MLGAFFSVVSCSALIAGRPLNKRHRKNEKRTVSRLASRVPSAMYADNTNGEDPQGKVQCLTFSVGPRSDIFEAPLMVAVRVSLKSLNSHFPGFQSTKYAMGQVAHLFSGQRGFCHMPACYRQECRYMLKPLGSTWLHFGVHLTRPDVVWKCQVNGSRDLSGTP